MVNSLQLYFKYIGISVRGQMQYRASFVMTAIGSFLTTCVEFLAIWALFDRFKSLQGWSLEEVALLYGLTNVTFALAESIGRGFDIFPEMIKSGNFDRLLLRPRTTALQVASSELQLMRIGRMLQGCIVLIWATGALNIEWTIAHIGLLLFAIIGGACLFIGLFILQATLAFWTTESLEVMNTMTYGGNETAQYPLSIYRSWFRKFFTFVVPLACVTYFPVLAILGRADTAMGSPNWFRWVAPVIGIIFLVVCLQIWKFGVRHYRSTGS